MREKLSIKKGLYEFSGKCGVFLEHLKQRREIITFYFAR